MNFLPVHRLAINRVDWAQSGIAWAKHSLGECIEELCARLGSLDLKDVQQPVHIVKHQPGVRGPAEAEAECDTFSFKNKPEQNDPVAIELSDV